MRAKEFIVEFKNDQVTNKGSLSKRQQQSTKGLHVFTDTNFDRIYMLNRVMMAVASADGIEKPVMDGESWAGKRNTAHPYTDVEHKMLKHAYDAVGIPHNDLNDGDLESKELDDTNVVSPIKPFKGY
jgi:hypothetical protein